jgi:putative hydrolase of the HAD superfamily
MFEIKAALLDADGVVIMPQKLFSRQYAEKYGYDPESFQEFFTGEFSDAINGKADLKDLIRKHNDIWHWNNDPQELLDMWFAAENVIDKEVLEVVAQQRDKGLPVYMATNQEQYRAMYLREVMFPDVFDSLFVSSEIGYMKRDPEYWVAVLGKLEVDVPGIKPEQIVFFDDSQDSIDGAAHSGIRAYLYKNIDQMREVFSQS